MSAVLVLVSWLACALLVGMHFGAHWGFIVLAGLYAVMPYRPTGGQ